MSGHKHATITISQDEYRRLHDLDMEQRFKKKKNSEDGDSRYNALWDAYQLIEERQKEYENVIANMNQDMAAFEAEQSNEILSVQGEYYQSLINELQDIQEENIETQNNLRETTLYFEEVIQNEQIKAQQRFDALLQQVSSIAQDQNSKEDHAREWIENCSQLSNFIKDKYDYDKFYPKEFDRILQRLNLAIQNLNRGYVDSGLQFAQEAFLQFSELRISLEERTSKWQALYQVLSDEVQRISEDVSNTPVIPAIGIEGEALNIDVDLEYWSNGRYSVIQNRLKSLIAMLAEYRQEISFDDLDKLSKETIPIFRKAFSEIVLEARQNSINSQIKINIAYLATKALEKHGFSLKQAQYKNGDMRDAFSAELSDEDGSNIILQITPNKVDNSSNLVVDTLDNTIHTEDEFMRRWEEINYSLEQAGVQVGPVQVTVPEEINIDDPALEINPVEKPFKPIQKPYYVQSYRVSTTTSHS